MLLDEIEAPISGDEEILKPTFPPTLTIDEIMPKYVKNKSIKLPNAFIIYRMALMKEYRKENIKKSIVQLAKIARNSWSNEPLEVKHFYNRLAEDVKSNIKNNKLQITFDKNVNEVGESMQVLHSKDLSFGADLGYANYNEDTIYAQDSLSRFLTIEDSIVDAMDPSDNGSASNSQVETYLHHNFLEDPNDQEYKTLEELEGEFIKDQDINHISDDSNPFNSIQLNEPTIKVWNDNGLNFCCNSNFRDDSEFISIKSTISPGISATSYIEIEKLQKLLISRKDDINDLLKSQPVYAIGIDFHNDSISPCISCWVSKPLDISILECLEAMFENQFEAIYQISIPDKIDNQNLSELSSSSDHITKEFGDNNSTRHSLPNNIENLKKEQESVKDEDKDISSNNNGSDNDYKSGNDSNNGNRGGDGNGSKDNDSGNNENCITISSAAIVNTVDPEIFQKFTFSAHLHAKFSPPNLEYEIDLYSCKTGKMLSYNLPFYKRRGHGYFLDSVEVGISPISCIPNDKNNLFISLNAPYPQQLNRSVEISNGRETNFEGQIGAAPNISAKGGIKSVTNTKFTSDEWELNYSGCHTTGDAWSYRYVSNNLDKDGKRRTSYVPGRHSAKWQTKKNMSGFRINITQIIRYKNFNANFAKLARSNRGIYDIDNNINIGIPDIQNLDKKIIIKRSFVPIASKAN
ncbi:9437_t:CDS:2 [Funneliformis mosseae]|uniref:9437_t:CDS:1 n=1 Tax=Funneliformis mosseae TaxID=27381 RepID=A0A9N9HE15_FUNMO|nr:9437_t:CDS:2 [Funneliformis mosseae]